MNFLDCLCFMKSRFSPKKQVCKDEEGDLGALLGTLQVDGSKLLDFTYVIFLDTGILVTVIISNDYGSPLKKRKKGPN